MEGAQHQIHEGRRSARVRSKGTVQVADATHVSSGRMIDVSCIGVRVAGDSDWCAGQRVLVDIRFDSVSTIHYAATGRVTRASESGTNLAIDLDIVSPELAAHVLEEIIAGSAHDAARNIILVDAKSPMRSAIASAFREQGWFVVEVS